MASQERRMVVNGDATQQADDKVPPPTMTTASDDVGVDSMVKWPAIGDVPVELQAVEVSPHV